ncbi:hypothetical protein CAPTEDRAFT_227759 [Capitella teleta]|uniref:Uncharacterized protein n=1 Tax=Capitella teleta TaxID=283909 RepID=R7T9G3_CAPTE|nr:hypothetical protein CAPTEDRAFT_227759 [Capitella teleta]|eukprot:ELT90162.1 hypothetical protein CAPTEDRAFT_227759 [Capitella teleta]
MVDMQEEKLENGEETKNEEKDIVMQNEEIEASAGQKKKKMQLTPEEQRIVYELRSNLAQRTHDQNTKLSGELAMHRNLAEMRRRQQERVYSTRVEPDEKLSRINAIKLMRMYERRAKEAEMRANQLEEDLNASRDLAKRYHDMYVQEKEKATERERTKSRPNTAKPSNQESKKDEGENKKPLPRSKSAKGASEEKEVETPQRAKTANGHVTEDDLQDDEAVFKRHVEMIAETRAMKATSPIRITDIVRKSECLILENERLKREVKKLVFDNTELIKRVKNSTADRTKLMNCIGTSEQARCELVKRLQQERQKHQRLNRSMNKQASEWIQYRKGMQDKDEQRRWAQVGFSCPSGAEERSSGHSAKRNVYKPRSMFPVEQYSAQH